MNLGKLDHRSVYHFMSSLASIKNKSLSLHPPCWPSCYPTTSSTYSAFETSFLNALQSGSRSHIPTLRVTDFHLFARINDFSQSPPSVPFSSAGCLLLLETPALVYQSGRSVTNDPSEIDFSLLTRVEFPLLSSGSAHVLLTPGPAEWP